MELACGIVGLISCAHQFLENIITKLKETTKQPFRAEDFSPKLVVQRATFENTCRLLLFTVARNRQDVENMFHYRDHPVWTDITFEKRLKNIMGDSHSLCVKSLQHIRKHLEELYSDLQLEGRRKERKERGVLYLYPVSIPSRARKDWGTILRSLQYNNDVFYTLVRQISSRCNDPVMTSLPLSTVGNSASSWSLGSSKDMSYNLCHMLRASQDLYDTLNSVWYCRTQSAHSLSIFLDLNSPEEVELPRGIGLRFNLAVTTSLSKEPRRLVVDATRIQNCSFCGPEGCISPKTPHERSENFCPRDLTSQTQPVNERQYQSCASKGQVERTKSHASLYSNQTNTEPRDLSSETDLCHYLEESLYNFNKLGEDQTSFCLGYLQAGKSFEYLFFYVRTKYFRDQSSFSLADIFIKAKNPQIIVSVQDRLHIAKIIATGVHHSLTTSWIPQKWDSKDIRFIEVDRNNPREALETPFLDGKILGCTTQESASKEKISAVTNPPLVSLGVVLLELAFSAPLSDLRLLEDSTESFFPWEKEDYTVMRLIETVSRQLGSRYAKVVQTCFRSNVDLQGTHDGGKHSICSITYEIARELDQCYLAASAL